MAKNNNRPATPPEGAVEAPQPAEEVTGREDHLGEPEELKDAPQGDGEPPAPSAPRLRVVAGRSIVTLSGDIAVEGDVVNENPDRLDIPAEHVEGAIAAGALAWI